MKRHLLSVLIALFLVAGIALLLYPTIGEYINSKHATKVITEYHEAYVNTEEDKIEELIRQAEAFNNLLKGSPSDNYDTDVIKGYNDILNMNGSGIMGYIDIDKIGVELPIYHGVSKEVLQVGVGHLEGSSFPVGGEGTHCVLSGHRGLPSAKLFTDLDKLETGDRFTITVLDRVMTYEVDQIKVVLPENSSYLHIEDDKDYCTLVTCTPYGINTHRLLVRGVRVDDGAKKPGIFVSNEAFRISTIIVASFIELPMILLVVTVVIIIVVRRTKRHETDRS